LLLLYFKEILLNIFVLLRYTRISEIHHSTLFSEITTAVVGLEHISCLLQNARPYIHLPIPSQDKLKLYLRLKLEYRNKEEKKTTKEEEKGLYREAEKNIWVWVFLISTYLAEMALQNYRLCLCSREV